MHELLKLAEESSLREPLVKSTLRIRVASQEFANLRTLERTLSPGFGILLGLDLSDRPWRADDRRQYRQYQQRTLDHLAVS